MFGNKRGVNNGSKFFFFFKQKTAYEIYQCDWSSDVCSSDLYLHYANRVVHMKDGKIIDIEVRKEIRPSDAVKKEDRKSVV